MPEADHVQSTVGGRRKIYVLVVRERSIANIGDRVSDNRAEEVPIARDFHLVLGRIQYEVTAVGVAGNVDVAAAAVVDNELVGIERFIVNALAAQIENIAGRHAIAGDVEDHLPQRRDDDGCLPAQSKGVDVVDTGREYKLALAGHGDVAIGSWNQAGPALVRTIRRRK